MKSKSIYYVYKNTNGEYHSERRAIVYSNKHYLYIKEPSSDTLSMAHVDTVHTKEFSLDYRHLGYYWEKPNKDILKLASENNAVASLKSEIERLEGRGKTLLYDLEQLNSIITEKKIKLADMINKVGSN